MANTMVDTGHGASIVFGTSGEAFNVTGIKLPEESREVIPDHHLLSTRMTKRAGDLSSHDVMTIEYQFDAGESLPVTDTVAQTVTVTFGTTPALTTAATYAGTALITKVGTPNLQTGELQTATMEVTFDEKTGPTFTAAAA